MLVIEMSYLKMFMGLKGDAAILAMICVVLILSIIILTIIKKVKDK